MRRAFIWIYPGLMLAFGVGFLVWSFSQAADANAYRRAPQCADTVDPSCYEVFTGVIASVHVSQSRSGERDDVVVKTEVAGDLTATLEPSDSAAPHVRTGANATVKRYRGQVTLVTVDGYDVASTANPLANQNDAARYGWLFTGLGVVTAGYIFYARRRRTRRAVSAGIDEIDQTAIAQGEILPSGSLGWSVRPKPNLTTLSRYAIGIVALIFLTLRALLDPNRTQWALALDSTVVLVAALALWLFYRNARIFADGQQVAKVDLFGRTKSLRLRDVKSAERFSVTSRYGANKHLVFVGPDGRKAFEVAGIAWDFDRLDALCREAGIHLGGSYEDLVGGFRMNTRVPGTTDWTQQLVLVFGLIVVIVLFVFLLVGPTQR